jgi:hypothetical protein
VRGLEYGQSTFYEKVIMKPVLKREGGVRGKKEQHRGNIIKGHCMHVLKYHSETLHFVQLTHSNKKNRLLT